MKSQLLFFLFCLTKTAFGQIVYQPVFVNQCSQEVQKGVFWVVLDSITAYRTEDFESEKLVLPRLGKYKLRFGIENSPITIYIQNEGLNRDTLFLPSLNHAIYVSNPPFSEYYDCDSIANGKVIDYYAHDQKRMEGLFEDGQPIDSLFSYHRNGQLAEIFIPNDKHWSLYRYFENGQLASIFDGKQRFEKIYFENGQLKEESTWSRKYRTMHKKYFFNGQVQKIVNARKLKVYDSNGNLQETMQRKEVMILNRIFSFDPAHRNYKFYEYDWNSYDENGLLKRKIAFHDSGFYRSAFPDSIQQIEDYLFEKVVFYEKGVEKNKIEKIYVLENNEYTDKIVIYEKIEGQWREEMISPIDKIYQMIKIYSE